VSQENIEAVRAAFYPPGAPNLVPRFADKERLAATLERYLHPDFELVHHELAPPEFKPAGPGARAFVEMYAEWLSAWETFHITPLEFHDLDDRVLAIVRMGGRTKTHGAQVDQESAVLFGVEDGLIRWIKLFTQAEDARREAGVGD
jgi:ketosteroid isomerase-like protein